MERRKALGLIAATGAATAFSAAPAFGAQDGRAAGATGRSRTATKGGYTFALDKNVRRTSVRFTNRYGIEVAADLYVPKNTRGKLPALVVSGPFGAVKEQSSGLHANEFARRGYVALAFDPSFTGESGGTVRDVGSPDIYSEDYSAAVDFLGLRKNVDRERIGAQAICGLSGMALTAAAVSRRWPRPRCTTCPAATRTTTRVSSARRSWTTSAGSAGSTPRTAPTRGSPTRSPSTRTATSPLEPRPAKSLPADAEPITKIFFDYYRTERGHHPRSINSTTARTATTPMPFFAFPMMTNIDMLAPRKALLVAGADAHSRYYSEDVQRTAPENIELVIVPGADHVDVYDRKDLIPFDRLDTFFTENLA